MGHASAEAIVPVLQSLGYAPAFAPRQRNGLGVFVSRGCAGCHDGPALGGTRLTRFGVVRDYWLATGSKQIDVGRYAITRDEADRYVFRVPVLRHVARTPPGASARVCADCGIHDGASIDPGGPSA